MKTKIFAICSLLLTISTTFCVGDEISEDSSDARAVDHVKKLIVKSPGIMLPREYQTIVVLPHKETEYKIFLRKSLKVTPYRLKGRSESMGIKLFRVSLPNHRDEVVALKDGSIRGLETAFQLDDLKETRVINGSLYLIFKGDRDKGYIKLKIENGKLKVERRMDADPLP